jgi:hypothetical protein
VRKSRQNFWKRWLAAAGALLLFILSNRASAVVLEWDSNTETNLAGYRLYVGEASRNYSTVLEAGNQNNREVTALQPGTTFYFAVTAYNSDGLESDFSEEISYTVPVENSPPAVSSDAYNTTRNQTLTVNAALGVLANDSDSDGDTLAAILLSGTSHGSLGFQTDGSFTYTPANNFTGSDSFTYQATDGKSTSSVATVTLTVTASSPINQPPITTADAYEGVRNQPMQVGVPTGVLANDSDPDGDSLSVFLVTPPSSGLLTLQFDGRFTFQPANNFSGVVQFAYRATDGKSTSSVALVTLTIRIPPSPTNQVPAASGDAYTTSQNTSLAVSAASGVLINDTDLDGDALTAMLVTQTTHGAISLAEDGSFTYMPATNYTGTDLFAYVAADGKGTSSTGFVVIVINAAPPVQCSECYNRIAEFLTTHDKPLAPGSVTPSDEDCLLKTATLLERAARAFRTDPDANIELLEIEQCLSSAMNDRISEQTSKVAEMYPSKWRVAASNAMNVLPAKAAEEDALLIARSLVRRGKALKRIEQFIALGMPAPHSLDSRILNATLVDNGIRGQFTITFVDGAWFTTAPVGRLNADGGAYRFEQIAWNQATLDLMAEGGDTLTLHFVFGRRRVTVSGDHLRGWFVPH